MTSYSWRPQTTSDGISIGNPPPGTDPNNPGEDAGPINIYQVTVNNALLKYDSIAISTSTTADPLYAVHLVNASGGTVTLALPVAADLNQFFVKKVDTSLNKIVIDPNGSELIDGFSSVDITMYNDALHIIADGTGWNIT